jgi:hypothetical protein
MEHTVKKLKALRGLLLAEAEEEDELSKKKVESLLEKEFARGGMQVQALDYGKKRRKRR